MPRARHIAIDGPAGTGKSTIGSRLADFLDYAYLDTGIMYRALTCLALEKRIHVNDSCALDDLCQVLHLVISSSCIIDRRQYAVSINGKEISRTALHNVEVTHAVPLVSAHVEVRRLLRDRQRQLAHVGQFVMIGCDIGTVVLPDADLKIFLTASLEERAFRRYKELLNQCERNALLLEDIREEIRGRAHRDHDRMMPASDAIIVDTSHLSIREVSCLLYDYAENGPSKEK